MMSPKLHRDSQMTAYMHEVFAFSNTFCPPCFRDLERQMFFCLFH